MPGYHIDFSKMPPIDQEESLKRMREIAQSMCDHYWFEQSAGFERAKNFAAKQNSIILLKFGYPTCHCCQSLEETVFSHCDFGQWAGRNGLFLVKFNVHAMNDADNAAAAPFYDQTAPFHITGYPHVFALASDGHILGQIEQNPCGGPEWIHEFEAIAGISRFRVRPKFDPNLIRSPLDSK